MNFLKRLASDTMWYGMSSIVSRIVMFVILTPYIVRITTDQSLGVNASKDYGTYSLMYALAAMLIPLFTFRMETAFFRFGSKRKMDSVLWTGALFLFFMSCILSLGILSNDSFFAQFLTEVGDERFIWYIVLITFLDALSSLPFAYLRLEHKPRRFAFYKILNIIFTIGFIFFFIEGLPVLHLDVQASQLLSSIAEMIGGDAVDKFNFFHEDATLDYLILANVCASVLTLILLSPIYFRNKFSIDRSLLREMVVYAAPLVIVGVAAIINQVLDRILVKQWLPGTEDGNIASAGIYSGATRLAVIMSLFTQAYNYAAEPFFFKSSDEKDALNIYGRSAEAFFLFGFMGYLLISLNLCWIKYYLPDNYWTGLEIVPILLMSYLLLGLYYNLSIWYKVTDNTKFGAYISIIGAAITIGLNYLLIPTIGEIGAAFTSLMVYSSMCLLSLYFSRSRYPIPYHYKRFLIPIAIYLVLGVYFYWFQDFAFDFSWQTILVNFLLFIISVSILLFLERKLVREMMSRIRK